MSDNNNENVSNAQIMHSIGQLTGTVQAMHTGMTARIEDIRRDIIRMEQSTNERINRVEDNLTDKIKAQGEVFDQRLTSVEKGLGDKLSSLGTRVTSLETAEKDIIKKVAAVSGVSGVLVAVGVELIKHIK